MLKLKRIVTIFVATSFFGMFWANLAQAVEVTFPDSNLEDEVRYSLNQPTGSITDADMATLSSFSAMDCSISNIQGLEYATNLTELELDNNDISNLSLLSGLTNLTNLYLGFNAISDVSPLSGLTNLTDLELYYNDISDTSSLVGLTNLTRLDLNSNQIEKLDLRGSNFSVLEYFDLGNNPVTEVCLADATLSQSTFDTLMINESLYISGGLSEIDGITKLDLSGVDFSNISSFTYMYAMNDLETLLLTDATNLSGNEVAVWSIELNSLNWLDVVGLWESFDTNTQDSLLAWSAIDGNTLVIANIPGDANGDGRVDGSDVTILAGNWQHGVGMADPDATWAMGDFNGDGKVDGSDVTILAGNWQAGVTSNTATAVPEPATLSMLLLLILAAILTPTRKSI